MLLTERIKELCEKKSITVYRLEKDLEFGHNAISRWDINKPSIDKLQKVADYFNVSMDYLAGRVNLPQMEIPEALKNFDIKWMEFIETADKKDITPEALQQIIDILSRNDKKVD